MIRNVFLRMMVAEMMEYAWLSDDCIDGGICVFSADMQVLLLR